MNSHDIQFCVGHAIPGILISLIAFWWIVNIFRAHFSALDQGRPVILRPYYLGPGCHFPAESVLKIVMAVGEIINEICLKIKYGDMQRINDAQHLAMYVTIGLLGLVELLRHYRFDSMPEGTERAAFLLWITTLTVSLAFHEIHDAPLRNLLHQLLVYVNFAIVGVALLELQNSDSVILALGRSYLLLVQGSWFCQLAVFMADPTRWDQHSHQHRMYFVLLFIWHLIIDFVLVMLVGGVTKMLAVRMTRTGSKIQNGVIRKDITYAPLPYAEVEFEGHVHKLSPDTA